MGHNLSHMLLFSQPWAVRSFISLLLLSRSIRSFLQICLRTHYLHPFHLKSWPDLLLVLKSEYCPLLYRLKVCNPKSKPFAYMKLSSVQPVFLVCFSIKLLLDLINAFWAPYIWWSSVKISVDKPSVYRIPNTIWLTRCW